MISTLIRKLYYRFIDWLKPVHVVDLDAGKSYIDYNRLYTVNSRRGDYWKSLLKKDVNELTAQQRKGLSRYKLRRLSVETAKKIREKLGD